MAFDKEIFVDGESTYEVPYWRKVVEEVSTNADNFNYSEEFSKRRKIQENEVGLKHPKNNSFVKIKDDGTIEAFAGNGSGVKINPDETMQFFGNIQVIGNSFQGISQKNEATFNAKSFGDNYPSIKEKGLSQKLKDMKKETEGS